MITYYSSLTFHNSVFQSLEHAPIITRKACKGTEHEAGQRRDIFITSYGSYKTSTRVQIRMGIRTSCKAEKRMRKLRVGNNVQRINIGVVFLEASSGKPKEEKNGGYGERNTAAIAFTSHIFNQANSPPPNRPL